jgi:hypothetical protein
MSIRSLPWMENTSTPMQGPKAGHVPVQRLNRTEYAAMVKALVGVDVKDDGCPAARHPGQGFDNIAVALSVSPAFLQPAHHRRATSGEARHRQSQSSCLM